jgi:hypothetical protein
MKKLYVLLFAASMITVFVRAQTSGNDVRWSTTSDSTKKAHFLKLDGRQVLKELSRFHSPGSWTYKGQNPQLSRHYGPMAQDFHHAFGNDGIGNSGNDTLINSADMNGVLFIVAHALVERTEAMIKKTALQAVSIDLLLVENKQLKADNQAIKEQYAKINETLNAKLAVMEKQLKMISLLLQTKITEMNGEMAR